MVPFDTGVQTVQRKISPTEIDLEITNPRPSRRGWREGREERHCDRDPQSPNSNSFCRKHFIMEDCGLIYNYYTSIELVSRGLLSS